MADGIYFWLVLASLKGAVLLAVVCLLALITKRSPSSLVSVGIFVAILSVPLLPLADVLLPVWKLQIPALQHTAAFPGQPSSFPTEASVPVAAPSNYAGETPLSAPQIVIVVWLTGALILFLVRCAAMLRARLLFTSSRPLPPEHPLAVEWLAACRKSDIQNSPWILENSKVDGPYVFGLLRPAIVIPGGFSEVPVARRRMIFLHEAAHISRHDIRARLLLEHVGVLFWFHPLIWVALRRHDLEVEKACDDAVIQSGCAAPDYAETLIDAARNGHLGGGYLPDGAAHVSKKSLSNRLRSIVNARKQREPLSGGVGVAAVAIAMLCMLPLSMLSFSAYEATAEFEPLVPNEELRGLWLGQPGRGAILPDWSGHGRHARIHGAIWIEDPQRGSCLSFDGIDDYLAINAPDCDWTHGEITLAMWLKLAPDSDGGGLLLKGDMNRTWSSSIGDLGNLRTESYGERELALGDYDREFYSQDSPKYGQPLPGLNPVINYFGIGAEGCTTALEPSVWTHLALVRSQDGDLAEIRYYIDGVLVASSSQKKAKANSDWPTSLWYFGVGESPMAHHNNFEGHLDDLAVFQRALAQNEIEALLTGHYDLRK